jgi:hypothetical protein
MSFPSRSNYYNMEEASSEMIETSMLLMSISEDIPMQNLGNNSSTGSLRGSMSRSKSYKVDLSCLSASNEMPLSPSSQQHDDSAGVASWGYFVDSVNQR